jgi:Putative adhesin
MAIRTDNIVDQQFEVGPGAEISVNNISGHTTIRGGEGSQIRVRAVKHGRDRAIENTDIVLSQEGSHVTARVRSREEGFAKLSRSVCSVDFEIEIPRDCVVHSLAVSADTFVTGLRADARIESVSGRVRTEDLIGACTVSSISGNVEARSLEGNLRLNTTSGDASVTESSIPEFNCHTVSGDLAIETPLLSGQHYLAKTVSGDLTLRVPPGTGATIQMHSISGNVRSDIPAEIIRSGRRNWQGRINGGGATLEMHTVSGDMQILASPRVSEATSERAEPAVADGSDIESHARTTTEILERLARGEITVDEATAQLKALR